MNTCYVSKRSIDQVYEDLADYLNEEPYIDAFEITPVCVTEDDLEQFFAGMDSIYLIDNLICSAGFLNQILQSFDGKVKQLSRHEETKETTSKRGKQAATKLTLDEEEVRSHIENLGLLDDVGTPEIYNALAEMVYPKIISMIQESKKSAAVVKNKKLSTDGVTEKFNLL